MSSTPPSSNAGKGLPVVAGPLIEHEPSEGSRKRRASGKTADVTYSAQILSGGEKRGLRGGSDTLGRAKSTYLKSEYSGPNDRRPQPGRVTKTEI